MQWPLLSGCRLGTGAIRRLISGHCCHWPVVPSTPRRSLRNTASGSDLAGIRTRKTYVDFGSAT